MNNIHNDNEFNLIQIIINIQETIQPYINLIVAFAYISGIVFMFIAVLKLKKAADYRQGMYEGSNFAAPMVAGLVGIGLIYVPTVFKATTMSVFGSLELPGYIPIEENSASEALSAIFDLMRLVGVVSFIKGWFILSKLGKSGEGSVAKGLTHILGGLLAYHSYEFYKIVAYTLGAGFITP